MNTAVIDQIDRNYIVSDARKHTGCSLTNGVVAHMAEVLGLVGVGRRKFNKNFFVEETENKTIENSTITNNNSTCPECGNNLEHEGGCVVCKNCGWSKCN